MNYLEKCSNELIYIRNSCSCCQFKYKTVEFSFNCSKKFPYEIVQTHKCVEYCDNVSLLSSSCILNYHKKQLIK